MVGGGEGVEGGVDRGRQERMANTTSLGHEVESLQCFLKKRNNMKISLSHS